MSSTCWCLGNFFNTAAVLEGGNAIAMPQTLACQLITSGAWGIVYYRGDDPYVFWICMNYILPIYTAAVLGRDQVLERHSVVGMCCSNTRIDRAARAGEGHMRCMSLVVWARRGWH